MARRVSAVIILLLVGSSTAWGAPDVAWYGAFQSHVASKPAAELPVYQQYTYRAVMCVGDTLRLLLTKAKAPTIRSLLVRGSKTSDDLVLLVDDFCDTVHRKRAIQSTAIWDDVRQRLLKPLTSTIIVENLDEPLDGIKPFPALDKIKP